MIDFRSDTVTMPTPAMRKAMAEAEVGDDVYGEDPTVNALERRAAEMVGMEASIFVSSGTQGNLVALLTHCGRGDEFIAGQRAHCYRSEAGGAAALGGIQPQPLDFAPDGTLPLDAVRAAVKPGDDFHYARSRLLCLENTQSGKVPPRSRDSASSSGRLPAWSRSGRANAGQGCVRCPSVRDRDSAAPAAGSQSRRSSTRPSEGNSATRCSPAEAG